MDKEYSRQIDELKELAHVMLEKSNYKDLEARYSRIQQLSTNEISIIRIISEKEEVIIKDILEEVQVPKSTLTSMIDRLEKRDLICRAISNKDRRSYKLLLTEEGKKTQEEHVKFEQEVYGKIIASLDNYEEREMLLNLIEKIINNMDNER